MKNFLLGCTALAFAVVCPIATASQADDTTIVVTGQNEGRSPFIKILKLKVSDLTAVDSIQFTVTPKAGSVTRPVSATYSKQYMKGRGYVDVQTGRIRLPVFGLYDGISNTVTLTYFYKDGSSEQSVVPVVTQPFDDNCPINTPTVLQPRTATKALSYDFILVANYCSPNAPTLIDTDGAVRWVGILFLTQTRLPTSRPFTWRSIVTAAS